MNILVCGGAGYIGAHMVKRLLQEGHEVVVLDNLSTGHREAVGDASLVVADLLDAEKVERTLRTTAFDAVLHFAAMSIVADSMRDPYAYHQNNVVGTLNLLRAMRTVRVDKLIFSSTAAVYGMPRQHVLDEQHPVEPINPYGATKLAVERLLEDASRAYGLSSVSLRYFNAAGADQEGELGESHQPETHLIPNILRSALGMDPALRIFGSDYPTPDGTCVRDYIHVDDLVDGHACALRYLDRNAGVFRFNLGSGEGYSVAQVLEAARRVTGRPISVEVEARRAGDPATLVASRELAGRELGWEPRKSDLDSILSSAWRWHCKPRY
ncbi:UDP-glucose 4-epimerase GalE [Rhodanobacter sp. DHG33]|uniref:UDP-glucose 4-epimerase GalE n=1 Tax=Rhodanobacter sp. DHG33 TaxID=2775921 RepID=UPI00177EAA85|nr:UDP-glucose 4-epimerase GalE [Rhodanobacter sp. DHG33]MBD8899292.1 UDP-glucose 4-epimerase GalE [Rhodanobacter sp. DHG33]